MHRKLFLEKHQHIYVNDSLSLSKYLYSEDHASSIELSTVPASDWSLSSYSHVAGSISASFPPTHCSVSIQHLLLPTFSHEQETRVDFHHHGPILGYQEVFGIWKEISVFLYTFDMKILD